MKKKFDDIVAEADSVISAKPGSAAALEQCRSLFHQVLTESAHIDAMHDILRENLAGQREVTPDISSGQFVILSSNATSTWAILRHAGRSRQLYISPSHSLSAKIAGSTLDAAWYSTPALKDLSVLDRRASLTFVSQAEAHLGEILIKDGDIESLDLRASVAAPALTLRLSTAPHGDFEWAFDRATLKPTQISGIRQLESNIITVFNLLGAARSPSSVEFVAPFLDHHMHFIRWKAVQTIGAIDRAAGVKHVERFARDPHPEVREAARLTLSVCN